jgi:D-3-phosphoglycerate dehydrogenase
MLKILVTEPESCHKDYLALLRDIGKVFSKKIPRRELLKKISDYDILIIGVETIVDRRLLDRAKKLKIIGSHTTGVDHIDIDYATQKSIRIVTLRNESEALKNVTATAEHTMALILSLIRKIPWVFDAVRKKKWERNKYFGNQLFGKTMGVIGYGRLGSMVAKYGISFGMKVIAYDPYVDKQKMIQGQVLPVNLNSLLGESDIVTVHVKLTKETEGLIGYKEFQIMKSKRPIFVNTSRGKVVNENALLKALEKKWISGAAIDVLSTETISANPLLNNPLVEYAKKNQNLLITPHLGGATFESMRTTGLYIGEKIKDIIKDEDERKDNKGQ